MTRPGIEPKLGKLNLANMTRCKIYQLACLRGDGFFFITSVSTQVQLTCNATWVSYSITLKKKLLTKMQFLFILNVTSCFSTGFINRISGSFCSEDGVKFQSFIKHLPSSGHAISTDIPDPFLPPLSIVHCFRQVFKATSRIGTELLYVGSCWSSCFSSFMGRDQQEYIIYERFQLSSSVLHV